MITSLESSYVYLFVRSQAFKNKAKYQNTKSSFFVRHCKYIMSYWVLPIFQFRKLSECSLQVKVTLGSKFPKKTFCRLRGTLEIRINIYPKKTYTFGRRYIWIYSPKNNKHRIMLVIKLEWKVLIKNCVKYEYLQYW